MTRPTLAARSLLTPALALVLASTSACAPLPRPRVLSAVAEARQSPAARDAEQRAPQAMARAFALAESAERAQDDGEGATAQLLGERALAALDEAVALARLARAEERLARSSAQLEKLQAERGRLQGEQARVGAEADALELRLRVARDALPTVPSEPGSPQREAARLQAARDLATQARLLCMAASMLAADARTLEAARARLDALDTALTKGAGPTPIDEAIGLRSTCLSILTTTRRPKLAARPSAETTDRLLELLGASGLEPSRDDRGVVVTLRDTFRGKTLTPGAVERLRGLAQVAREHTDHPLLVVLHTARPQQGAASKETAARLDAILTTLGAAGAPARSGASAGNTQPLVPPHRPGAAERNERVEIVFVAPS